MIKHSGNIAPRERPAWKIERFVADPAFADPEEPEDEPEEVLLQVHRSPSPEAIMLISNQIDYSPLKGFLTWKSIGKRADTIINDITLVAVDGKGYFAHQVAWFLAKGEWRHDVYHVGSKWDNALHNLAVKDDSSPEVPF